MCVPTGRGEGAPMSGNYTVPTPRPDSCSHVTGQGLQDHAGCWGGRKKNKFSVNSLLAWKMLGFCCARKRKVTWNGTKQKDACWKVAVYDFEIQWNVFLNKLENVTTVWELDFCFLSDLLIYLKGTFTERVREIGIVCFTPQMAAITRARRV